MACKDLLDMFFLTRSRRTMFGGYFSNNVALNTKLFTKYLRTHLS